MGNFQQYQINTEMTADERDDLRNHLEWERDRAKHAASQPSITIGGRVTTAMVGSNGHDRATMSKGPMTAVAQPGLRPGHVMVNGVETTVEAAKAAGLISGDEPQGFNGAHGGAAPREPQNERRQAIPEVGQKRTERGREAPRQNEAEQQTPERGENWSEADALLENMKTAADKASRTIAGIEQVHGPGVVDSGLAEVAETGLVPDAEVLPQGVAGEHVNSIVDGYYAQANSALSNVGASVDTLMATMTDAELADARRATVLGDNEKLQHLGQQAVNRLALLPEADPTTFEELIADMRPDERKALGRGADGSWTVTVGGRTMSFAMAVREGIVRA